jgi:hypothetical protein
MNRIRIGLVLTFIIGCLYAAFALFDSLTKFSVGITVGCLAIIAYGLCDYLEVEHDHRIRAERQRVWCRRDDN